METGTWIQLYIIPLILVYGLSRQAANSNQSADRGLFVFNSRLDSHQC